MTFRPALRPGAVVLRRDARHLQVGTSPGVVLPDRPGLRGLLVSLDGAHDLEALGEACPEITDVAAVVRELVAAGLVVDASAWSPHHLAEARAAVTAPVLDRRRRFRVALHDDPGARPLVGATRSVLVASGVEQLDASDPDVLVVVSSGEPARDVFAAAGRARLPHLVVRLDQDRVVLGPFVVPGTSPCLGCHDLHRTDWDPAWAALVPQLGVRGAHHNPPAPAALVLHAAAVELAAQVVAVADTGRSDLMGRARALGPSYTERADWPIAFHHRCSCALLPAA